jgi:hypothetical protein
MLDRFENGEDGNKAACYLFQCLRNQAESYHRAGVYAESSHILNIVCVIRGLPMANPFLR